LGRTVQQTGKQDKESFYGCGFLFTVNDYGSLRPDGGKEVEK
jgi:hypothetical protein